MDLSEIVKAQGEIKGAIESLKSENEKKFKELESKGSVDAVTQDTVNRIIADIDVKFTNLERNMSRPGIGAETKESKEFDAELKSFNVTLDTSSKQRKEATAEEYLAYKKAFASYLRKGDEAGKGANIEEIKTMQIGASPDGGYLVRPQYSAKIIQKSFETSPIRQLATVESVSTDTLKYIVDFEEFDASFIAELASRATTNNSTFAEKAISVHEIYAKPKVSQQLLEDSAINVEAYVMSKIQDKLTRKQNTAFITGTGVNEPKGILAYANGTTYGSVEQRSTASSTQIQWNDLLNLMGDLKDKYHANATYLMRRQTFLSEILTNLTGNGEYIVNVFEKDGIPVSIAGYPVKFDADFPAVAANALAVAFGDFREAYTIADRVGLSVLRDPYSAKPAVEFYARQRVGGEVVNSEAYKILKVLA